MIFSLGMAGGKCRNNFDRPGVATLAALDRCPSRLSGARDLASMGAKSHACEALSIPLTEQTRQAGDVDGDPASLVLGQHLRGVSIELCLLRCFG
jgi:hypothetical protein